MIHELARNWGWIALRGAVAIVFGVMALAIAWSRVFVGTHYVTDVLGGAVTGLAAAILAGALYREGNCLDRLVTSVL